ncbi:hypothetical protein BS78_04G152300 [Paspalum vaginatum]|nr:hypothetical protein BS78_04G152300 [Paspalum vaginatum]
MRSTATEHRALSRGTMPPLDVVGSLVLCDGDGSGGGELKAACGGCETALPGPDDDDPYAPAESLRLRIGQDIDWSDVVVGAVAVLERDDSTKGAGANPKCAARRSVAVARTSMSAPAPRAVAVVIGGLPVAAAAGKKAAREHGGRACRVFASGEAAGADHRQPEPGSPKVSCLGGVRSQPRPAAEVVSRGRRWWSWLVADAMSCCWNGNGRRDRRAGASEAD